MEKIRIVGKRAERIVDIGPKQPKVDPKEVAKALGAEPMSREEVDAFRRKHLIPPHTSGQR